MKLQRIIGTAAVALSTGLLLAACEGHAAEEQKPKKNPIEGASASTQRTATPQQPQAPAVDAASALKSIANAIPLYAGAQYREDLTRRDAVMVRGQYGPNATVYTMATNDSYPQVYHYYATYLAQFRAYPAKQPFPPGSQNWRTLEVQLNQAMQDPFIPGDTLPLSGKQVTLQVAETEAEPRTVIRYIVTPESTKTANANPAPAVPVSAASALAAPAPAGAAQ